MLKPNTSSMNLIGVNCCICGTDNAEKIGEGYDFEYRTSPDLFYAFRCCECDLLYLNPRPDISEFKRIYPANYHSLDFTEKGYGLVHNIRARLETNRLLMYCKGIPNDAKILDMGCGDGFHLRLLREHGNKNWTLEGIDIDSRAVEIASKNGITIHQGSIEEASLGEEQYDVVYTIQTIEHVAHPDKVFDAVYRILKPGGKLVIVTDNTDSLDFAYFKNRHWGGYHFPRHWNLFNRKSLTRLAHKTGFEVTDLSTIVSPVNWVYSIHCALVDKNAPKWLINQFTLKSPISLGFFTLLDIGLQRFGRGALLNAYLRKPL